MSLEVEGKTSQLGTKQIDDGIARARDLRNRARIARQTLHNPKLAHQLDKQYSRAIGAIGKK